MAKRGQGQLRLGWAVTLTCVAVMLFVAARDPSGALAWMALAIAGVLWGVTLIIRGRKLGEPTATERLAVDDRPPVIYLRAFSSDVGSFRSTFSTASELLPGNFGFVLPDDMQRGFARVMNRIGPFVALGRPGEDLPGFGASREYVANDRWQSTIRDWMRRAALIVVWARPPEGRGGFDWELQELVRLGRPTRILLVCSAVRPEYRRFKQSMDRIFPRPLPEVAPESRLIAFRADWEALPLRHVGPHGDAGGWDLAATLEPVLAANSLRYSSEPSAS